MGPWRRLLRISWSERKNNAKILQIVGEKRILLFIVRSRSEKIMGHLIRQHFYISNIMEGRISGCKGKPRKTFIREMVVVVGCNGCTHNMKTLAFKREEWKSSLATRPSF